MRGIRCRWSSFEPSAKNKDVRNSARQHLGCVAERSLDWSAHARSRRGELIDFACLLGSPGRVAGAVECRYAGLLLMRSGWLMVSHGRGDEIWYGLAFLFFSIPIAATVVIELIARGYLKRAVGICKTSSDRR